MTDTTKPATPELLSLARLSYMRLTNPAYEHAAAESLRELIALLEGATLPAATPAATDERELFEAHWSKPGFAIDLTRKGDFDSSGHYVNPTTNAMFSSWQAARAQLAAPQALPDSPVAKIVMAGGEIVKAATYMPGLPDGEHELYTSAPASQAPTVAAHETQSVRDNAACVQPVNHNGIERLQTPMDALRWALDRIPETDRGDYWDRARCLADASQAGPSDADKRDAERYRMLRTDTPISAVPRVWSSNESAEPVRNLVGDELDAAMDALAAAQGERDE